MPSCIVCEKPLVSIGNKRKNGKSHDDWNTRISHKCCYKVNSFFVNKYQYLGREKAIKYFQDEINKNKNCLDNKLYLKWIEKYKPISPQIV